MRRHAVAIFSAVVPWSALCVPALLSLVCLLGSASPALAQADAREAYAEAKAAFSAGEFEKARELAESASQTDPRNPEVFLLLGKAHYQLGELSEAVAAWQRTLDLAPQEPFARRMLEAVRAEKTDVDLRIRLVEAMLDEELHSAAARECGRLLADKTLTDAQRSATMTLQAEAMLQAGNTAETQRIARQVEVLYPEQADQAKTALLQGRAKLRSGGEAAAEGVQLLEKVIANHPESSAAVTAQVELVSFRLKQGVDQQGADALGEWLEANPGHSQAEAALRRLIGAWLTITRQGGHPDRDAALSPSDLRALTLAAGFYERSVRADDADKLTAQLLGHLDSHYAKNSAIAAAVEGVNRLLAASLPRSSRLTVLQALAQHKTNIAMRQLGEQAVAGELPQDAPRGQLPKGLAEVLEVHEQIASEYPANTPWADRAGLAEQIRAYSGRVTPSAEFVGLNGPEAWALDLAFPVIQSHADAAAVGSCIKTVQRIVAAHAQSTVPASRVLAVEISDELAAAVPREHADWSDVMVAHEKVLDEYARFVFQENIASGNAAANTELSDAQESLLETLRRHIDHRVNDADAAFNLLEKHLEPWRRHRHWSVVERALAELLPALPEIQRRRGELVLVRMKIRQVTLDQQRLLSAGLTVPRELDARLKAALTRCYELQAGLGEQPALLADIRAVSDSIIALYKALKYYEVAEAAARVKAEQPVSLADEYAAFQLARLKDEHARRELARSLKHYGAAENIELTPEFQAAIEGWTGFIGDYPTSDLVPSAAANVFAIGQTFEGHRAHAVAANVYDSFAEFCGGIAVLSRPPADGLSTEQQAALAAVSALVAEASKSLAESREDREADAPPPREISPEYAAAVDACYEFIAAYPESRAVSQVIDRIPAVALEYARIDAWEVADGVYAELLESELPIRRVERMKFARGLCQLGRAMPDHARTVLQALTSSGLRGSGDVSGAEMLALVDGDRLNMDDYILEDTELDGVDFTAAPNEQVMDESELRPNSGPRANQPLAGESVGGALADPSNTPPRRPAAPADRAASRRDSQLLAMIRQQEAQRAVQVAQLRERIVFNEPTQRDGQAGWNGNFQLAANATNQQQEVQQVAQGQQAVPILSEAELQRQQEAIDAAYAIFQEIRNDYPNTSTAVQCRAEVMVMVGHWRTLTRWERAVALAERYLADNPRDPELPKLRLEVARDRLAWAAQPLPGRADKHERLDAVSERFEAARAELAQIVADFDDQRQYQQQAQWDIANSFLKQARVVAAFSSVLARGQFVRTAEELIRLAKKYPDHPQIGTIPGMLWTVGGELENRGFHEEAILVWNRLVLYDPMHSLSEQASLKIAQTYHQDLERPLKAAEAYQELIFARGGNDQALQNAIFGIGSNLKSEKRWVEALHVLETFVDSFPRHPRAGEALAMVGQIHQANEAWEDAIAAYRRVISEFEDGQFVHDAKWSIAECTINLSRWPAAMAAYRDYVQAYPKDAKLAEANRRIEVLKDLVRYQGLVDEEGQRKAFDAQYQIAEIVKSRLSNPIKGIIEYRKVVKNWPKSHLADDALYAVGATYRELGETSRAREALREMAERYPTSPLADDALYLVGKSYEQEADRLATVTRAESLERAKKITQRRAYEQAQSGRRQQQKSRGERIAKLKAAGKGKMAELEEAATAANYGQFNAANVELFAQKAEQDVETLTATQLADREDRINAALRKAVEAYRATAQVATADKADEALLRMATIYDQRLKDSRAAMDTWLEIVRQFSGTAVAEDASWRIAEFHERDDKYAEAIEAYESFLRNYRRSPKAGDAQFAVAENHERLGQWISAMDAYSNYLNNFPNGPLAQKAKDQINWIKTYRL